MRNATAKRAARERPGADIDAEPLESLLPEGHRARIVWGYVERQDLNGMYEGIKAREGGAGRSAIAPEILFALWLYATLENEGRAREVARLTQAHDAYRWICGGVQVNHHTLSDFRVAIEDDPGALRWRSQAAKERAVRERQARVQKALDRLPELDEIKKRQGKNAKEARASTTDAEATVMKMGDGGFRPAYNVQYGTDSESQVIVGAEVVTVGSGQGQMVPMLEQVTARCERSPEQYLVDGGYPAHEHIDAAAQHTEVYAPVPKPKDKDADPHAPKVGDSEAVAEWRERPGGSKRKRCAPVQLPASREGCSAPLAIPKRAGSAITHGVDAASGHMYSCCTWPFPARKETR